MGISLLALGIFWLRLRARNAQSTHHEDESAESGLLDESDSHFDHLMAADMVVLGDLPDLEQRDVKPCNQLPMWSSPSAPSPLSPCPSSRNRLSCLNLPTRLVPNPAGVANRIRQLVPDEQADLGLGEEEVDLAAQEPGACICPSRLRDPD